MTFPNLIFQLTFYSPPYHDLFFFPAVAQSPSSSDDSNDDDDKDSKSEDESDSSDDTFVKDSYYSSSSVWRSYTTRGQVKGNKEGEPVALLEGFLRRKPVFSLYSKNYFCFIENA